MSPDVLKEWAASWKALAGPDAVLEFREPARGMDASLSAKLAELRSRFTDPVFQKRFLNEPATKNADREAQWCESRRALGAVLDALLARGFAPEKIRVSLSHTSEGCVAVGAVGVAGAGVDLEDAARAVSDAAVARFVDPAELAMGLAPLEIWAIKEACFKADPENEGAVIANYRIASFSRENGTCRATGKKSASLGFECRVYRDASRVLAYAVTSHAEQWPRR